MKIRKPNNALSNLKTPKKEPKTFNRKAVFLSEKKILSKALK